MQTSEFGSWTTPITAELITRSAARVTDVRVDGDAVVWSEARPEEGGRVQLIRREADGTTTELLPEGFDARTSVHEYGGGDWWVRDGAVWFANWRDQRLYRLDGGEPEPLTPEPEVPRGDRYADGGFSPDGTRLVVVREHHPAGGGGAGAVRNELVELHPGGTQEVLVSGPDFVASPRFSPDARRLAWVSWNHPDLPWDDTVLTVRELATGEDTVVAGGPGESVGEPRWHSDGTLCFVSDRTGWWNLYRWTPGGGVEPAVVLDAEIGVPGWQLGTGRYALLPEGRTLFARWSGGLDGLAIADADGTVTELDLPFTAIRAVRATGAGEVVVLAGSPVAEPGVYAVTAGGAVRPLREPRDPRCGAEYLSGPEAIDFPSGDRVSHALFYPPANPGHTGPEDSRPPLIVMVHGGPTSTASPVLSLGIQYWTSRGFAVVDVNYGGSTGFGRAYREQLRGAWGRLDVADCLAAARWLAAEGRVDGGKLLIRGGSAGGFTVLAALAREDTPFAAGTDLYGVADLEVLAADTHKFESRYLDRLIGPYPEAREVYVDRSPIHRVDAFSRPLLVLQGADDPVVPPNQSELIVDALRARKVPVAYLVFEGEQHGFRRAESIRRSLDAELSFYSQILGFPLPAGEAIEPVEVENLP
ncbi:prolyl oligopeptidase family serine peptidase [Amycolatopsis sp. PS_44_ISF1]|uniref:S9 family peptidase n=1 Tax=Amycolatopsis sp. PS_44_ISF1 TaxID=2974917 RepID=UPI0028DEF257|nr:prolyl oligopeptidase family serine peptidase [Amycolatopsis sp. PS_44_ISF1]MDT8913346.1 prolyl oligopeptidase family serine peptidase [Amycolatopsis sp. PS_44_ISF1]